VVASHGTSNSLYLFKYCVSSENAIYSKFNNCHSGHYSYYLGDFPLQRGPAKRGSGQVSLGDIDKVDDLVKQFEDTKQAKEGTKSESVSSPDWDPALEQLSKDIEKLRKSTVEEVTNESDDEKDKT
jgi:hypothetical protein